MDERGIKSVLRDVLGRGVNLKTINGWVSLRCPFAPWRHEKREDRNTSAGVKINNKGTSVFNCLAGETLVTTRQGDFPIRQLAGTSPELLMPTGEWQRAPIRSFGVQKLLKLTISRNGVRREEYATAGHRWFVQPQEGGNYRELTTVELRAGQRMQYAEPLANLAERHAKCRRVQWQVVSVADTDREEEVYCAEVARHHAFTLSYGLVTGNCFSCHSKFPLHAFVETIARYTNKDFDDLVEELRDQHYLGARELPPWDGYGDEEEEDTLTPLHEDLHTELYDSAEGHRYLRSRGISDRTAKRIGLLLDPEEGPERVSRILFPVKGPDGALYGFSGRDTTGRATVKARDYFGLKKRLCVLGSHLIAQEKPDKIVVVEGLFDYANGWEHDIPTCALMHSTLTPAQRQIFLELGLPLYVLTDDDKAGRDCAKMIVNELSQELPVLLCPYPEVWIDDDDERDGGHWVKDPGEFIKEDFDYAIRNAEIAYGRTPTKRL